MAVLLDDLVLVEGAVQFSESLLNWTGCISNSVICVHGESCGHSVAPAEREPHAAYQTPFYACTISPDDLSCLSSVGMLILTPSSVFRKARISQCLKPRSWSRQNCDSVDGLRI